DPGAVTVGVVTDEMLHHRHDMLRLDALDLGSADCTSQEWVFAEGVVPTIELKVAIDIDERLQRDIDAEGTILAAYDHPIRLGRFPAERGSHTHGCGQCLCGMASQHPGGAVGESQSGNPEPGDALEISGLSLIQFRVFLRTVDQCEFLGESHPAEQLVDPLVT